ncbi:M13 family metallopeptidase [Nitrospirillum sp. BR 11163]|uniref:M13 family metallopeptidase n=1 Tax=Nitrospirillum sp. BR 11163 TaxID=3104323 RepID=UPI002AFE402E|nr:M13 family metallopeptidase [Nitrospirillum sp. BR 11163]MEA1676850.1 M13 family metallopeptidase [Nitrospirillum sp. BR 11163]
MGVTRHRAGFRLLALPLLGLMLTASSPAIPPWGFDLGGMDRSIKPGDDFDRYSSGAWKQATPIPPDRSAWGPFAMLRAKAENDVKAIVDDIAGRPQPAGSIERKIADTYSAYLDTKAIEAAGLAPARADLALIATARSHKDVARLMGHPELGLGGPVSLTPWPDAANPDRYAINIVQSGLSLPDRDFYLKTDTRSVEVRAKFQSHVARMLALCHYPNPEAAADAVLALETAIAQAQWTRGKRADRDLTYHPKSRAALKAFAPDYPWDATLAALGIPRQDFYVLKEDTAIRDLARLFRRTPVATWRAYMTFHYLNGMADVLPAAFDDLSFDFNGRVLSGLPQKRERWKRATVALNAALGEAVGQLYVQHHFTPDAKAQIMALVENLRTAFRVRVERLDWMSAGTKRAALAKLAAIRVKVGYPDSWRDYATLEVRAGDPLGNRKRALLWDWKRRTARLGQPTDRDEWGMTPQNVNAYSNSFFNEIVFPAAILQPPYFDSAADPAVNYGGIGGVIGHEMSHAFDDQGAKTDAKGAQRDWWDNADATRFKTLTSRLAEQYSRYEPIPGIHLNGQTTLSENIGDLGGLNVALEAYHIALKGKPPPILDGTTGDQRVFLSWAQTYRENIRDEALRAALASDPHSPSMFRVNGIVRNIDAWYDAFGVKPGDRLYLDAADRVHIW